MSVYTEQDLSSMRYYLKELKDKYQRHPQSLCLRNGIAHIEQVLGLPPTVTAIDPLKFIDKLEDHE